MTQAASKPARPNLEAVSAVVTVTDVGAAIAFYRDKLGLAVQWQDDPARPSYAIVFRGALSIHLQPGSRNPRAEAVLGKSSLYVWVDDAAALHAEFSAAGAPIAVALSETPYGTREFAVRDPDGNGLSFAENVSGEG